MASLYHWVDGNAPYYDGYANNKKIHSIKGRLLIIHGLEDDVVPFRHSELLYDNYIRKNSISSEEKDTNQCSKIILVKIPNVGHNDMHDYLIDPISEVGYQICKLLKNSLMNLRFRLKKVLLIISKQDEII